jgi:polysaccharide export outer membrane protein
VGSRIDEARRRAPRGGLVVAAIALLGACAGDPPRSENGATGGARATTRPPRSGASPSSAPVEPRPLVEVVDLPSDVASDAEPAAYRLAVGDTVKVVVVGQPDLSAEVPVPPRGQIELAVVGQLPLLGRTPQEVSEELLERLVAKSFLVDPQVSVSVTRLAPRQVFLVEGVEKPEAYELPPGGKLHLTQVIALAGGLAKGADPSQTTILRRRPGVAPQLLRVDLRAILDQQRMDADPVLEPDDTVIVRDMKQGEQQVFVTGRVRTPGAYRFSPREGLTFLQSIVLAGGLDKYAAPGGAALLRRTDAGRRTIRIDLDRILGGELDLDVALQPGDVVFIPESFF